MIFAVMKYASPVNKIRKKPYYSMRPRGIGPFRLAEL